jgi:hypothetical protein
MNAFNGDVSRSVIGQQGTGNAVADAGGELNRESSPSLETRRPVRPRAQRSLIGIMQVIEAQRASILELHDHLHNKHERKCLRVMRQDNQLCTRLPDTSAEVG